MSNALVAMLVLLFPAAGAILLAGRGWRLPRIVTRIVGPGVVWASFVATLYLFANNVIGDVGMILGTFVLFVTYHQTTYRSVFSAITNPHNCIDVCPNFPKVTDSPSLELAAFLLLVGAVAKSAQIPLHTWLPDAMEGPTPVSALIHAATMVTAGVYLIARMWPLFEQAPAAADVGAILGCATVLVAATIALTMTDIKRVIAYSTMSQIGYMIMGVSSGAYAAGMFHLFTHAFFKALVFMAAGSIISAMAGEQ